MSPESSDLPFPQLPTTDKGRRICQVIKVRPERLEEYKQVHAQVWPEVLGALRKAHIVGCLGVIGVTVGAVLMSQDYSIHFFEPANLLIAHMRYIGDNFEGDMESIKEDETTRKWWALTDGMQESFVPGATGSESGPGWWTDCEEVFRMEG